MLLGSQADILRGQTAGQGVGSVRALRLYGLADGFRVLQERRRLAGAVRREPKVSPPVLVHHEGEAKRDYPASMLHQSYWYRDYHYVEDYFSRIHAALHGGRPVCSLLVLNPIESVWARAYSGSFDGLSGVDAEIVRLERQYAELFHILSGNQIDFDYGEEDIMARHGKVEEGILYVGSCAYRRVLVAGMDTMRSSTLALLEEFAAQGGEVIFAGEAPGCVDVIPSDKGEACGQVQKSAF